MATRNDVSTLAGKLLTFTCEAEKFRNVFHCKAPPAPHGKRLNYMAVFAIPDLLHKQEFGPAVVPRQLDIPAATLRYQFAGFV